MFNRFSFTPFARPSVNTNRNRHTSSSSSNDIIIHHTNSHNDNSLNQACIRWSIVHFFEIINKKLNRIYQRPSIYTILHSILTQHIITKLLIDFSQFGYSLKISNKTHHPQRILNSCIWSYCCLQIDTRRISSMRKTFIVIDCIE